MAGESPPFGSVLRVVRDGAPYAAPVGLIVVLDVVLPGSPIRVAHAAILYATAVVLALMAIRASPYWEESDEST